MVKCIDINKILSITSPSYDKEQPVHYYKQCSHVINETVVNETFLALCSQSWRTPDMKVILYSQVWLAVLMKSTTWGDVTVPWIHTAGTVMERSSFVVWQMESGIR